jgi:hypothetical protein
MARPRNNVMKLPRAVRWRVFQLVDNGASYDEVRSNPEVSSACSKLNIIIHNASILAYMKGKECEEYKVEVIKQLIAKENILNMSKEK